MYHALLTNRYLTTRVIPLIAVAAVALCVALVIIVVSVMTGFLDMVKNSGRTLIGDVVVAYPVQGIPYYERLIERLEALPEAAAATPVVDHYGMIRMPYADSVKGVHFWGIEPISFAAVTGYEGTLHWRELNEQQWNFLFSDLVVNHWRTVLATLSEDQKSALLRRAVMIDTTDPRTAPDEQKVRQHMLNMDEEQWGHVFLRVRFDPHHLRQVLTPEQWQALLSHDARLLHPDHVLKEGLTLRRGDDDRTIVLGMHVSELNVRQRDGSYVPAGNHRWWMPRYQVTLTTIPVAGGTIGGADTAESRILQVVNEKVSGIFVIDNTRVMIPLSVAQSMLHLDEAERMDDPDDPFRVTGVQPARATMVLVRAAPGVTPERLRDAARLAYHRFADEIAADDEATMFAPTGAALRVMTWAEQQAAFIGPVEKEREMMRTLFSLVYLVCAGLVLAIFWAIVYEKTRDIGILRSVGASRIGISWIFLRYGLLIGIAGAIVGLGLAYVVVKNINVIHEALGNPPLWLALGVLGLAVVALVITIVRSISSGNLLPVVMGGLVTLVLTVLGFMALWLWSIGGIIVWDPAVYYFTTIPNNVDMNSAVITMIGAVIFSLVGAFIPAAKAADTDPVKALRYE